MVNPISHFTSESSIQQPQVLPGCHSSWPARGWPHRLYLQQGTLLPTNSHVANKTGCQVLWNGHFHQRQQNTLLIWMWSYLSLHWCIRRRLLANAGCKNSARQAREELCSQALQHLFPLEPQYLHDPHTPMKRRNDCFLSFQVRH